MQAEVNSVEKTLISSGLLSEKQIGEIREMFMIVDADKSGEVSYDEVAKIMSKLSKCKTCYVSKRFAKQKLNSYD